MRATDEDEQARERARLLGIPDEYPGNYDADDLRAWMLAAEPGSAEQLLLTMLHMAREDGAEVVTPLAPAIWASFRARVDPTRHRRSEDVEHRLPFPLSQGLIALAFCGQLGARALDLERAAVMVEQMLECFPDEHPRVRCRLASCSAALRLQAGHEAAHAAFERLMREHPRDPVPIAEYVRALRWRDRADREEETRLLRRVVELLEPALEDEALLDGLDDELGGDPVAELEHARDQILRRERAAQLEAEWAAELAAAEADAGDGAEAPADDGSRVYFSFESWLAEQRREPHCNAINHGRDQLHAWMLQAEPGSMEQGLVAAIVGVDNASEAEAGAVIACRAWAEIRARLDPARHRRSTDVEHRLPFPLSQALVALVFPGVLAQDPGVLDLAAAMANEILASFPDEDPRVVRRIASDRARMRVAAGHEDGHAEAERLIAAYPDSAVPVDAYVNGLQVWCRRAGADERRALLQRMIDVLEHALSKGLERDAHEWHPEEELESVRWQLHALDSR